MINVIIIVVSLLLVVRTMYVSTLHSRAISATAAAAARDIRQHKYTTWRDHYRVLDQHYFLLDLFNLSKWRYADFFPDIPE